jgi:fido (protein-threonine AMPylation protein)
VDLEGLGGEQALGDTRRYSDAEERRLADQLDLLTQRLYAGEFRAFTPGIALLCAFHGELFRGVRDHAGRIRNSDFGQETLTFGPNRSVHRTEVPRRLQRAFEEASRAISSFDSNQDNTQYEEMAIRLAVWIHAEVIGIHPFEDGNGRTSRLLMNWMLLRMRLLPVQMHVPKQEYRLCLNRYYAEGDIAPLTDLVLRLYLLGLNR